MLPTEREFSLREINESEIPDWLLAINTRALSAFGAEINESEAPDLLSQLI
jgi:hypothetical protein